MLHSQCFWGCWFGVSLHFSSFSWGYFISRKHPKKSQILFPLKPESLLTQIFKIWKSKYLDKNLFDKRFISFSDIKTARWVLRIHKSSSSLWILLILPNWRTVALLKKHWHTDPPFQHLWPVSCWPAAIDFTKYFVCLSALTLIYLHPRMFYSYISPENSFV